jgi:hypothetical protein
MDKNTVHKIELNCLHERYNFWTCPREGKCPTCSDFKVGLRPSGTG